MRQGLWFGQRAALRQNRGCQSRAKGLHPLITSVVEVKIGPDAVATVVGVSDWDTNKAACTHHPDTNHSCALQPNMETKDRFATIPGTCYQCKDGRNKLFLLLSRREVQRHWELALSIPTTAFKTSELHTCMVTQPGSPPPLPPAPPLHESTSPTAIPTLCRPLPPPPRTPLSPAVTPSKLPPNPSYPLPLPPPSLGSVAGCCDPPAATLTRSPPPTAPPTAPRPHGQHFPSPLRSQQHHLRHRPC